MGNLSFFNFYLHIRSTNCALAIPLTINSEHRLRTIIIYLCHSLNTILQYERYTDVLKSVEKPRIIVFLAVSVMPPICLKICYYCPVFLYCFFPYARMSIGACFVNVQSGFLQLLLTQTWVKCTSLNSSRRVAYFGKILEAVWTASKNLAQDK